MSPGFRCCPLTSLCASLAAQRRGALAPVSPWWDTAIGSPAQADQRFLSLGPSAVRSAERLAQSPFESPMNIVSLEH